MNSSQRVNQVSLTLAARIHCRSNDLLNKLLYSSRLVWLIVGIPLLITAAVGFAMIRHWWHDQFKRPLGSQETPRWRKPDSNSRFRRRPPASLAGFGSRSRPTISRYREIRQRRLQGSWGPWSCPARPRVRSRLPPSCVFAGDEAPLVEIDRAGCSTMGRELSPVRLDVLLTFRAHDQRWAWHIPR